MNLSELCIRRPVFATVLSLLLVLFGLVALQSLAVREYPDINRPVVSITTIYRGASAAVVENKITQAIEDRIAGIEGILKLESDSEDERSSIRIEFDVERDIDAATNDVRDRISRVMSQLPPEAEPPQVSKADATAEAVMFLSFNSEKMTELEVTDYAERYIVDRLSTVPGVARAALSGGRRAAMRIWIDRQALAARALTVGDIENALRRENVQLPAGRLESKTREFSLRTEVGLDTEEDFRNLAIGRGADGHLVRLGEVADVRLAAENTRSMMRTNGRPGVGIGIEAQSKANVLEIVKGVRAEVTKLQAEVPPGSSLMVNVDNGIAIEAALREVLIAVVFAFLSVLLVIFAFLGNLRTTLIPAVTIPVSVIAAFMAMCALGYSINVLTLLGVVLAIGLVVDDAIVVLENIHRRAELGENPIVAAVNGSREIGFAVIATTLTLVAVFVPISFLPGDIGRLFREFGLTLAAAVLFSSLIALTLTPMMASKLPAAADAKPGRFSTAVEHFFARLSSTYEARLRQVNQRPWLIVGGVVVLSLAGVLTFRALPSEFTPTTDIGRLFISMEAPEGASFEYTEEYGRKLEEIAAREAEKGDIRRVTLRLPGGLDGSSGSVNNARLIITMVDWGDRTRSTQDVAQAISADLRKLPGVRATAMTPGALRGGWGSPIEAVHRRAGLREAGRVVDEADAARRAEPGPGQRRQQLQAAQAADPRRDQPRPRRRPRHLAADRGPHARDRARLAHRHHVHRPRPRVQRHPAGQGGRTRDRHRPDQPAGALRPHRRADPAREHRRAEGDGRRHPAQPLQPAARGGDQGRAGAWPHDGRGGEVVRGHGEEGTARGRDPDVGR